MKDQKPIMKETMNESVQHIRGDNISQFKPQPEILNSQNEGHLSQTKLSALSPNHTYMLDKSRNFIPKELEKSNGRRNAPLISY